MVDEIARRRPPDPSLLDRIARVAHGVRAARRGWCSCTTTSRRPSTSSACTSSSCKQCYHGRRELTAYIARCDLALGDSEFNRQELEALGFPPTGVLPVVPDFAHLDVPPDPRRARGRSTTSWTNILFVGRVDPEQEARRCDPRPSTPTRRCYNPRSRLLLVGSYGGFETYLAHAARARRAARRAGRPHPRPGHERGADGALRRRRSLPLRQRARGLLRAARSRAFYKRCRCSPTPRRRCRRRWTAAACCTTRKDPFERRAR